MDTTATDTSLVDNYFFLLKDLSPDNKLELISRLSKSMKSKEQPKDDSWKSLFGALVIDQTAEEFADDLKKDRTFIRKDISL